MKGKQRSIWISDKDWAEFKKAAALEKRSISQYLLHLHKLSRPDRNAVIVNIEEPKPEKKKDQFFRPYSKDQQIGRKKA